MSAIKVLMYLIIQNNQHGKKYFKFVFLMHITMLSLILKYFTKNKFYVK
jgi:hypothetical protein